VLTVVILYSSTLNALERPSSDEIRQEMNKSDPDSSLSSSSSKEESSSGASSHAKVEHSVAPAPGAPAARKENKNKGYLREALASSDAGTSTSTGSSSGGSSRGGVGNVIILDESDNQPTAVCELPPPVMTPEERGGGGGGGGTGVDSSTLHHSSS
jgi:hypothetical protein